MDPMVRNSGEGSEPSGRMTIGGDSLSNSTDGSVLHTDYRI
jgi:hypothetical protein